MSFSLLIILSGAVGYLLSLVIPSGVEPGTKYAAPTEEGFQLLLKKRGLDVPQKR